ncbi:MAG: glycoside hydrolase family 13 protein [Clostridiales Family XIII bacterium]|jgi:glycosidase|nr:glycoside hydrolase family 13 protein [Clostridiales Family XIII bacterium]
METLSFGSISVTDMDVIHDSAKERFRRPLGAVPCETEVAIYLRVGDLHIERAALCLLQDGRISRLEMFPEEDLLSARSVVHGRNGTGDVLWYWFEITLQGGSICYYGADTGCNTGLGRLYRNPPPSFQITVYESSFHTPDWAKGAVLYQIFPDRFRCGDPEAVRAGVEAHQRMGRKEIELHETWNETPVYAAKEGQKYYMPCDMFGGDLEGVRLKLPYLTELGVTAIYLNPIFESASNHRYNTGDYRQIDPILGGDAAFDRLAHDAKEAGIRILLDGVFSHTGDDSVYFNKYGRYGSLGAYQSAESPYFSWYDFQTWPDKYTSWWGFETLPEVREYDENWGAFIIDGEDSVVSKWMKGGASGYRLDVADELPDETIERIRAAVKREDPEGFLIGEVWEDATTKQYHGQNRRYALGLGLDSVMNYPFANHTVDFLTGRTDAVAYRRFFVSQYLNYPHEMLYTLMNLLSSHDIVRIRTRLSNPPDASALPREEQAVYAPTPEDDELGSRRQRLAAAIQFSAPGIPTVYYGDEVGMIGLLDPFNRLPYQQRDTDMLNWHKKLSALHASHPAMQGGAALYYSTDGNVFAVLRYMAFDADEDVRDAVLTVVNPTEISRRIVIDFTQEKEGQPRESLEAIRNCHGISATSEFTGQTIATEQGLIDISIGPLEAEIFSLSWE